MKFYKYLCWTIKKLDSSYFLDRLGSLVIFDPENWRAHGVRSVCNDFSILFSSKLVGMKQDNRFFLGVFVKMKLKPRTVLATNDHSSCCLCVISSEFLYFLWHTWIFQLAAWFATSHGQLSPGLLCIWNILWSPLCLGTTMCSGAQHRMVSRQAKNLAKACGVCSVLPPVPSLL